MRLRRERSVENAVEESEESRHRVVEDHPRRRTVSVGRSFQDLAIY